MFWKCSKFNLHSKNATKILQKIFVFKIIAFEMVAGSSPYHDENTRQVGEFVNQGKQ